MEQNTGIIHLFSRMGFKSSVGFLLSLSLALNQVIQVCIMMLTRCGLCSFVDLFLVVGLLTAEIKSIWGARKTNQDQAKIKLRQKRLRRPPFSSYANNTCNYLNERAWCKRQRYYIYSKNVSHTADLHTVCRHMQLSSLISLKSTLFMHGLRAVKSIHHHWGPWQELIAGLFIEVCVGISPWVMGVKAPRLTTAAARSAPSEVQLRTSVSTPNTIILQTRRKETARSRCSSEQQSASQMQIIWRRCKQGVVNSSDIIAF